MEGSSPLLPQGGGNLGWVTGITAAQRLVRRTIVRGRGHPLLGAPPHRSRRAELPHRALRNYSLCTRLSPDSLFPAVRFAAFDGLSYPSSVSFAGCVAPLPPSPCDRLYRLRVLRGSQTPAAASRCLAIRFSRHYRYPIENADNDGSPKFLFTSLPACHVLTTPTQSPDTSQLRILVIGFHFSESVALDMTR